MSDSQPLTQVLRAASAGDTRAAAELLPLVYVELRKLAAARMARTPPGNTLQPTALVHEVYLRLVGEADPGWQSRAHFFGAAARSMRQILIDQARRKLAVKHGGDRQRVDPHEVELAIEGPKEDLIALDAAITQLEAEDARKGTIVNLRYFVGLSVEETAEAMGLSVGTIEREWRFIKRWLYAALSGKKAEPE